MWDDSKYGKGANFIVRSKEGSQIPWGIIVLRIWQQKF